MTFDPKRLRLVSGGQTGVDRAALDAALAAKVPCGGFCPKGRRAEDGVIPARYPVQESLSRSYIVRTVQNLLSTEATVIFHAGPLCGGTRQTAAYARLHARPLLLLDAAQIEPEQAARQLRAFCRREKVRILNVAGPRASQAPALGAFVRQTLERFFSPAKKVKSV